MKYSASTRGRHTPRGPFRLQIGKSTIHRRGVFATESVPANRKVIEYTGKILNRNQAKAKRDADHLYLFSLDERDYWFVDGSDGGSGAEFVNHSCDPNLRAVVRGRRVFYFSKRKIRKGEELTVDYNLDSQCEQRVPCHCGSRNCRGTINKQKPEAKRSR